MLEEKNTSKLGVSPDPDLSAGEVEAQGFDHDATKKLLRKLDWHIIPFMSLIYLLSVPNNLGHSAMVSNVANRCFLDRTNIGNARLDHLEQDLKLHGLQYNDCLAVLFPFYIAAEIPSNIMMKLTRPSIWLSFIMFCWSAAMIAQGFVSNYSGLMATRVFLGVFEGGLFPGVNFLISSWYQRHECGFRMALFFSAATLAGAFGGILARGIAEMSGVGGKSAWSWIFILEGLLSILVSMVAYWCIHDYPATATFLTPKERDEVERRLQEDHGHLSDDFDMKNMGYSANDAQLMSVPPYVCACFFTIAASWYADRIRRRGVFMLGFQLIAIAGFTMLAATARPNVQYAGTVFAAIGIYPQIPLGMAWNSANIGGSLKRATGIAMQASSNSIATPSILTGLQVMGGNCGGIIASYVYISRDGPRYIKGHCLLIAIIAVAFCLTFFMSTWSRLENARRDKIMQERGTQNLTEEQRLQERELADNVPCVCPAPRWCANACQAKRCGTPEAQHSNTRGTKNNVAPPYKSARRRKYRAALALSVTLVQKQRVPSCRKRISKRRWKAADRAEGEGLAQHNEQPGSRTEASSATLRVKSAQYLDSVALLRDVDTSSLFLGQQRNAVRATVYSRIRNFRFVRDLWDNRHKISQATSLFEDETIGQRSTQITTFEKLRTTNHRSRTWRMETIPTIHDITLPRSSTYITMLVLPNMDPSLHTGQSPSLPRALLRHFTSVTARLSIILLKVIGTAVAMILLPRTIHISVQCLDSLYELLGRRARSPWDTDDPWGYGALAGLAIMVVLHDLLRRISYNVVLSENVEAEQTGEEHRVNGMWKPWKETWEKSLMRVLLPVLIYGGLYFMAWQVWRMRKDNGKELVKSNTVDITDDEIARLVWRDR
ncbi:hypothetical protein OPT61_g1696 [Boeremia exigua]|uniref:Uncharacterized protein n=1 Tax=Boeremia exigua TaxID=749465 RepID=A0ACC2IPE8_9PLEO|nr:hypothetical protein OPT61_g1696 [Boeremia exigua]